MKKELSREEYKLLVEKAPIMIWRSDITVVHIARKYVTMVTTGSRSNHT